jgi:hypothetical protein
MSPTEYSKVPSTIQYGMVSFEEEGMPWTRVFGKARLISKETIVAFGPEPHWLIMFEEQLTYVPESAVTILTN